MLFHQVNHCKLFYWKCYWKFVLIVERYLSFCCGVIIHRVVLVLSTCFSAQHLRMQCFCGKKSPIVVILCKFQLLPLWVGGSLYHVPSFHSAVESPLRSTGCFAHICCLITILYDTVIVISVQDTTKISSIGGFKGQKGILSNIPKVAFYSALLSCKLQMHCNIKCHYLSNSKLDFMIVLMTEKSFGSQVVPRSTGRKKG